MYHSSLKYAKILLFFSILMALLTITAKQTLTAEMEKAEIAQQIRRQEEQQIIKQFLENNNQPKETQLQQQVQISKEQLAKDEFNNGNIDNAISIYQELLNQPEANKAEIKNKLIECYRQKGLNEEADKLLSEDIENSVNNNDEVILNQNNQE